MTYEIVYSPRALGQLGAIFDRIAERADPYAARRFTAGVEQACQRLRQFPLRTTPRDDIRPGLRMTTYRRRVVVVLSVESSRVVIHGIFYGGQDYAAAMRNDRDPPD